MPKRGSRRKKTKTHQNDIPEGARPLLDDDSGKDIPRSLVVRTSKVTSNIQDLVFDLRKLMSPSTASNLREKRFVNTKVITLIYVFNNGNTLKIIQL